jgi:small conductance mechanosensitive channel
MTAKDITLDLIIRYGFQVLGAIIILTVGVLLARWIGNVSNRWLESRVKEPPMRLLMVRAIRILVILLTLLVALDKFGFQIAPLVAAVGVVGVGVGFAFQGVLGNIVAGLSIIFTKPYRVGEYIELLNVHGQVVTIELFSTTLVQLDQSRVVIPNRRIVGEILHNYGTIRQLQLKVGVAYGVNLDEVLLVAKEIAAANPRVLKEPAPLIGISELADSSVTLSIQPWVTVADMISARAELYQAIVERFPGEQDRYSFSCERGAPARRFMSRSEIVRDPCSWKRETRVVFHRLLDYKIQSKVVSRPLKQSGADINDFFRR